MLAANFSLEFYLQPQSGSRNGLNFVNPTLYVVSLGCPTLCGLSSDNKKSNFCAYFGFSTVTITVFAFERWLAICYPLKIRLVSKPSRVLKIVAFLWLFAIVGASPLLIFVKLNYMKLPEGYVDLYQASIGDNSSIRNTEFCAIDHYSAHTRNAMLHCSFWIFFAVFKFSAKFFYFNSIFLQFNFGE